MSVSTIGAWSLRRGVVRGDQPPRWREFCKAASFERPSPATLRVAPSPQGTGLEARVYFFAPFLSSLFCLGLRFSLLERICPLAMTSISVAERDAD